MKHLGSQARRRRSTRLGARNGALGLATAGVFAVALVSFGFNADEKPGEDLHAEPVVLDPSPSAAAQIDHVDHPRRLPFEPLVESKLDGLMLPSTADAAQWQHVTVAAGDNLSLIFSRLKLSKRDLHTIAGLNAAKPHLKRLKPGQLLRVDAPQQRLNRLVIELDELTSLWIERTDDSFSARSETVVPEIRVTSANATIERSLFMDGQKAGLDDATIMRLTKIFGWDIDFALDIRARDYFSVIFEQAYKDGQLINQGRILAAEFINQGRSLRAVLFTNAEGESDYYSDDGDAMRKAFLRTPVNFSRISSRFNLRRKHPVLNKIRAHKGVDYAAPLGTPVRATANGKINFVGTKGGYGKTVKMQHGEAYSTLYAHLSRFPKGLKRGAKVKQGQVIGYVGKSGLATGPHLHYEFQVNGTHRNPLTVNLPKAMPIDKRYLSQFHRHAAPLLNQLDALVAQHRGTSTNNTIIAQLDPDTLSGPTPSSN